MNKIVIMLFASTFGIATIVSFWGSGFVQRTLTEAEELSIETDCPSALLEFYSGSYNDSTKNLVLILESKRSVDLKLENLYLFYPNGVMEDTPLNETVEGNIIKSLSLLGIDGGFMSGRIKTNCPEVSVDFTHSQVT